jgi:hypothetical protein
VAKVKEYEANFKDEYGFGKDRLPGQNQIPENSDMANKDNGIGKTKYFSFFEDFF